MDRFMRPKVGAPAMFPAAVAAAAVVPTAAGITAVTAADVAAAAVITAADGCAVAADATAVTAADVAGAAAITAADGCVAVVTLPVTAGMIAIDWLGSEWFLGTVAAETFGADVARLISFELNGDGGPDQFSSDLMFGDVVVEKDDGSQTTESIVIKVQPRSDPKIHAAHDYDAKFHNEVLFYSKLMPLLQQHDTSNIMSNHFCEYVHGKASSGESPEEDVIVLKRQHSKGFKLADEKLFLDEKHIKLALDRLAKFHALSMKVQAADPAAFNEIVGQIKSTMREPDGTIIPKDYWTLCVFRGIEHLQNDLKYKDKLADLQTHLKRADYWMRKHMEPAGSLNVITHGNLSRNNMLFKYDANGEPVDVVFIDMAALKHGSPVMDLSLFLLANASPDIRKLHWDTFLRTYHDAMAPLLVDHPHRPTLADIELDLRKKGVYGYYLGSHLLSTTMGQEEYAEVSGPEEVRRILIESGGSEATEYLAAMVTFMLDRNFIFEA